MQGAKDSLLKEQPDDSPLIVRVKEEMRSQYSKFFSDENIIPLLGLACLLNPLLANHLVSTGLTSTQVESVMELLERLLAKSSAEPEEEEVEGEDIAEPGTQDSLKALIMAGAAGTSAAADAPSSSAAPDPDLAGHKEHVKKVVTTY